MKQVLKRALGLLLLVTTSPSLATAHASLETGEAPSGAFYKAVVKVPHGCQGSPTTALTVTIPTGLVSVKPMPKPGWQLATRKAAYPAPVEGYKGKPTTEGVVEIVWSGGRLLDEHYDEFVFQALVSPGVAAGTALAVPVRQTCETGEVAWSEVAEPGSDAKLAFPAPILKITPAKSQPSKAKSVTTATGLDIGPAWSRATPQGAANGAAFLTIRNTGTVADRLIGAELDGGKRTEIHETTSVDGIMRMRHVGEIVIPAGATVELKPGGLHIMIMGLDKPVEAGSVVKGTLVFEKAGRVAVTFPAAAVGAQSPESAAQPGTPSAQSHH
ncbi:MAG: DUF1775 domain-containing protein [Hyphomicrobiaceae bacterium]|nr:DUF1775 domain-containing protein [Hyphomicrobiaceae bacterium]